MTLHPHKGPQLKTIKNPQKNIIVQIQIFIGGASKKLKDDSWKAVWGLHIWSLEESAIQTKWGPTKFGGPNGLSDGPKLDWRCLKILLDWVIQTYQ